MLCIDLQSRACDRSRAGIMTAVQSRTLKPSGGKTLPEITELECEPRLADLKAHAFLRQCGISLTHSCLSTVFDSFQSTFRCMILINLHRSPSEIGATFNLFKHAFFLPFFFSFNSLTSLILGCILLSIVCQYH